MFEKKITAEQKRQMERDAKKTKRQEKKGQWKSGGKEKVLSVVKTLLLPALFAGIVVCAIYLSMQQKASEEEFKTTVVCMKEDVPGNTYVTAEDIDSYFITEQVEIAAVPATAYRMVDDLPEKGFYIDNAMAKSQMVLKDDLADTDAVMDKYKAGYEVTSFHTQEFANGVNGSLRKGDIVDVYAKDPATEMLVLLVSDVYISDVYDNSGKRISEPDEIATSFTVYVTEEEVEQMNLAVCYGGIQMYLKTE